MKLVIVDEKDRILGTKYRSEVTKDDIYRVSSLWIMNEKNKSLFAQRAFTKDKDPGEWGPAVSGTIEEGEDYYSNIVKEADEELGLQNIKPVEVFKEKFVSNGWQFFNM
ncbi:MAG: NUDIX domain-containing protein, partial [Candidatus Dojkabacteria bacterium]|nr:NUDIX domain-containing protein [Candidatus Dojkabacteria bacterium]